MLNKRESGLLDKFNEDFSGKESITLGQRLKIFNFMLHEYISLRIYKKINPLEGIETDIRVAKILNSVK